MAELGMQTKMKVAKEMMAKVFIDATSSSANDGIIFKYKSYSVDLPDGEQGWVFDLIYKEPVYPERVIQQFKFERPANIDHKNMEWHVLISVMTEFLRTSASTWDHLGKLINSDILLQNSIRKMENGK